LTPPERARAAKAFLANPLQRELLDAIQSDRLREIVSSDLTDVALREQCYLAIRALDEMRGQLEVWAREAQ
jgi:hypothetical protein